MNLNRLKFPAQKNDFSLLFEAGKIGLILLGITCLLVISSCKKTAVIKEIEGDLDKQIIWNNLDSIYLYAKQIYLWNEQLPSYERFLPRRLYQGNANGLKAYKQEIFEFSKFAVNSSTGMAYEYNALEPTLPKYSTIVEYDAGKTGGNKAESSNSQLHAGFGLSFHHNSIGTWILYVDLNSPAGKSGLKRGDRITAINDEAIKNRDNFSDLLQSALTKSFVKLTIVDRAGKIRQVRLMDVLYEENPVLKKMVIDLEGKKIGFIAYNNFTAEANSQKYLEPALAGFSQANISELIVDLRYNMGGYQSAVIYFANQLISTNHDKKLMFTEHYNQIMREGKADILRHQIVRGSDNEPLYIDGRIATLNDIDYSVEANTNLFEKQGQLAELKTVYFIVSEYTASASELLINVLKPYMNVKIIGVSTKGLEQVRTYGKPIGFFDIDINKYKLFISMYQTFNANAEGDYFDGLSTEFAGVDDPSIDFGMMEDPAIRLALQNRLNAGRRSSKSNMILPGKYHFENRHLEGTLRKTAADLVFKRR